MRKTTLTVGMLLTFVTACGTTTTASPNAAEAPSASAPAAAASTNAPADTSSTSSAGASGTSTAGDARPMGTQQVIKTATFDAEVTVKEATEEKAELGDPAYAIDVRVQVTRGTYPAGTVAVQLVYANGSAHDQIEDPNAPHLAAELDAPSDSTTRFLFEHPAGAGVGQGARVTMTAGDGAVLATWLT